MPPSATQFNLSDLLRSMFGPRMLVAFAMGFASGLPLLLTGSLLQAWLRQDGVDLGTIGLFTLVGLPYTLKFLWAPLLDRFELPLFGRRRGWLLLAQLLLMLAIAGLGMTDPAGNPWLVAFVALLVTFFSAVQDTVIDAYRREDLSDRELGFGSSMYVNGYRVGMLLAGSGGLILADHMSYRLVYLLMSASLLVGVLTTLLAREPDEPEGAPTTLAEAVVQPFLEYFRRPEAWTILAFILLYKIGDVIATSITTPFYLDLGFSKSEIGEIAKLFGFWATIGGGVVGGALLIRIGIYRGLWIFGFLQAVSTTGFALLPFAGASAPALAAVIAAENLAGGMGTAAFVAFMASMTNKRFTATQYALLSSLMGVPRVFAAAPAGYLAEWLGWQGFFVLCVLAAIPGLIILRRFAGWQEAHSLPAAAAERA